MLISVASPEGQPSSCTTGLHLEPGVLYLVTSDGVVTPPAAHRAEPGPQELSVTMATWVGAEAVLPADLDLPQCQMVVAALGISTSATTLTWLRKAIEAHIAG